MNPQARVIIVIDAGFQKVWGMGHLLVQNMPNVMGIFTFIKNHQKGEKTSAPGVA